ncbi:lysozyme inhibitor LprI family protein [Brevundimonas sp.]|uniref:lysozyme inhibitor LprI family protein n=1 Tax=Brevundimonas sp. TaxID=1871086 RepID=UPI002D2D7AE6|nr:lysozyme inhibitor LprI family protein [Brevundimonas sp.]HYC69529.1 lysozyme inhibitor LprI family protein [Brevundimonas sp.]
MRFMTLTPILLRLALPLAVSLAGLAATGPARAQSFDCEAAFERVEVMICTDDALGALDYEMNEAWSDTIDMAADPAALMRSQRAWLRTRNACPDSACVAAAYRARIRVVRASPRAGWSVYRNPALGLTFEYLANREVRACPEGFERCVSLHGRLGGQPDRPLMMFQRFDGPLEAVAQSEAGFEARDGGWFTTYGRFEPQAVARSRSQGLERMQAVITCGISDENGFHAAAGECYWGVLSDGRRSVVITTEGVGGLDAATRHSVDTLQFVQP